MRITQEADYGIRICCILDEADGMLDAATIAERACISQAIALKTLKRLHIGGLISSHKGAHGGYELARDPSVLSVTEIIQTVEGEIRISKCLDPCHECTRNSCKGDCKMHLAFGALNKALVDKLSTVTVRSLTDKNTSASDIISKILS